MHNPSRWPTTMTCFPCGVTALDLKDHLLTQHYLAQVEATPVQLAVAATLLDHVCFQYCSRRVRDPPSALWESRWRPIDLVAPGRYTININRTFLTMQPKGHPPHHCRRLS